MKPILCDVPAFDKTKGFTGTFITNEQIYQHKVIIKDAVTHTELYSQNSPPDKRLNRFVIPPFPIDDNTLKNGCSYLLFIEVWRTKEDVQRNKSYTSDPVNIKCASTPGFQLDIYSSENAGYILKSTTLNVGVEYTPRNEDEPEQLNEYYVTVKQNNSEIYKSGLMYNIDEKVEINDLENTQSYTVTAYGKTINGMELSSSPVTVDVNYIPCEDSSVLTVKNDRKNACIILDSSIHNILYRTDKPPVYTSSSLNLSGNTLEYYDGFNMNTDFSTYVKYTPTAPDNAIINMNNGHIRVNFKTRKNYRLPLTAENITSDGNSTFSFNNDGTMNMTITKQYGGVWFNLPDEISGGHNFTGVTVKYKDGSGQFGYTCRYAGESSDSSPDTVWGNLLKDSGTYDKTFNAEKKLTRFKFFSIVNTLSADNPASVTITSVTFTESSHSLYQPYFELYTKDKVVIIDKNENGQPLAHIDTGTYSFNDYVYALKLARHNNKVKLKINDWRR